MKSIKLSDKSYKQLVKLKKETGISITNLMDKAVGLLVKTKEGHDLVADKFKPKN